MLQENVWSKFQWVAGTSTGAILTIAMAQGWFCRAKNGLVDEANK
jgi:predicted acylesterase/phospholipase RssA